MTNRFKKIIFIFAWAAIAATAGIFWYYHRVTYSSQGNEIKTITVGDAKFQAEVVSSQQKMELGLGGRENLCLTCGMLFVFPKSGRYSFWMKDMKFPLDILWISDNTIVHIEKNIQPDFAGTLSSQENADSVLEINAGTVDRLGVKMGDTMGL